MGTRHLVAVKLDGDYKVAQYGQWDGYPTGQGETVLEFLAKMDRPAFEQKLRAASFLTPADVEIINETIRTEGLQEKWQRRWPELSRDTGADILQMVQDRPTGIKLKNSLGFAADSLFCEWAYVIDLDANTLEVFRGFNKEPLAAEERFFGVTSDDAAEGYQPVKKAASYPLDALPTLEQMDAECNPEEEDA
jgi:hypothetical protein